MTLSLEADQVHLLRADLDHPPLPPARLERLLSREEIARADRFRIPHLRRRYVAATGLLRTVLAAATGIPPDELALETTEHGKPFLPGGPSFNLSHSGGRLLIGVTPEAPLGVDLELHRPLSDLERLTKRTFSPSEAAAILERDSEERVAAFFRVWTRKEALVKALGLGLGMPLRSFSVSPDVLSDPLATNALVGLDDAEAFERSVERAPVLSDDSADSADPIRSWWITPFEPAAPDQPPASDLPPAAAAVAWRRGSPPRLLDLRPADLL